MRINTRFTVAVHIMVMLELNKSETHPNTSELLAKSVGTNPVVIRQIMSTLRRAELIETQNGVPGAKLRKPQEEITLLDIYRAVQNRSETPLFDFHSKPNSMCFIGRNIEGAMEKPLADAQASLERTLSEYSLQDIADYINKKHI